MLDAVRMCGRWISKALLQRITARTLGSHPPSRQQLLQEFCRRAHGRDRKGKLCLSSANVCVKRLEEQGLVRFPPPAPRAARAARRKLLDDGQPLPPLPKLPESVEQIADLHLSLMVDDQCPEHLLWNRLISREHPLKGAPLVGAQLRYLIWAGSEVVGAFGFGPPSFYLSCRDGWIVQFQNLMAPHYHNTRRRMAAERVVFLAQDTTALSYNTLEQTKGLGPIGDERKPGRGLLLHSLQAFRLDGIPLGGACASVWARELISDTAHRNEQSIDQKESVRWVNAFQSAASLARQMPSDVAPGKLAGGDAGRLLGPPRRWPSGARPDGPWFGHFASAGPVGSD